FRLPGGPNFLVDHLPQGRFVSAARKTGSHQHAEDNKPGTAGCSHEAGSFVMTSKRQVAGGSLRAGQHAAGKASFGRGHSLCNTIIAARVFRNAIRDLAQALFMCKYPGRCRSRGRPSKCSTPPRTARPALEMAANPCKFLAQSPELAKN